MFNLLERREVQGIHTHDMIKASTGLYFLQRMKLDKKLCVHNGCVNTICWNEKGTLILSGSDDQHIAITDPFSGKNIIKFRSGHRSNIFSAKFLPSSLDKEVVSCSGSGEIFYTDIEREDTYGTNRFDCHFGSTYKLLVVPNEAATFLSCGDDGTVRFFDLRMKTSCSKFSCEEDVLIVLRNAVTSMAVDPVIPYQLAISSSDGIVRLYDRRMLKTQDTHAMNESLIFKFSPPMAALSQGGLNGGRQRCYRVTSLNYRPGSHDLLVNYSSENIYLFNTYDIRQQMSYTASQVVTQHSPASRIISTKTGGVASTSKTDFQAASTSKEADVSVASTPPSDADSESSSFKPIKRLRLRGDWSDTGPDARPEGEEPAQNIMQRMSDLLTRMLNSHGNQEEAGEPDEENGNNEVREELQEPPEDQAQASMSQGLQEPGNAGVHRREGSEAAATMLHSVMFGSVSSGSRAERDVTRSSISSEGMVSHDLSPQGLELSADSFMDTYSQRPVTNDSAGATSESSVQRQERPEDIRAVLISSGEDQDLDIPAQSLQSDLVHSVNTYESENFAYEESQTRLHGCDREHQGVAFEASNSSSEETSATVICAKNVSSTTGHSEDTSHHGLQEMDVNEHQKESEYSSREVVIKGMEFMAEKKESETNESRREKSKSLASLQINPSCSAEGSLSASKTDSGLQSVSSYQLAEKSIQNLQPDSFAVAETVLPQVLSDPSSSALSSDSFSVASLWSSSSSAATMAIATDGLSNSQQTLCNISSFNSLPTSASSITKKMSSREQDLDFCSQTGHGSDAQGQQISLPVTDLPVSNKKISYSDSDVFDAAEEADATFNQDFHLEMSSMPHKPCESCGKTQSFGGKGKGIGKSSCKQNYSTKSHVVTHPEKFSSYNSGKMRVSSDAPPDNDEAGTSGMASTPSMRMSGSNSNDRRRRHGHSLPPTGNFQLYGSDDEDDDDDDRIPNHKLASSNIGTTQDKERLSKAAQKIQEVFRQRREAREQARIKDVPQPRVFMKFSGHRNCRTVIKEANFYGDNYVMSGSDCGRIMFWERETGQLVMYLNADKHVVNCVQPNSYAPVLASSGIDYDVKIWCPLEQDSQFDEVKSAEIINRNERMLEVTRDTVTVPAAFMLRILASLSQIRNGREATRQQRQASDSASSNQD